METRRGPWSSIKSEGYERQPLLRRAVSPGLNKLPGTKLIIFSNPALKVEREWRAEAGKARVAGYHIIFLTKSTYASSSSAITYPPSWKHETDEDGKFRGKEGNLYIEFPGNFCKLRDTLSFANRFFPSRENRVKLVFPLRAARCSSIDTSWTIVFKNFPMIIFDENYFKMIEQLTRFDLSLYKNRMIFYLRVWW